MTKAAAWKEAKRRWKHPAIEHYKRGVTRAEREQARIESLAHYATHPTEPGEPPRFHKECLECKNLRSKAWGSLRYRVGSILMGMAFVVEGEGDSWAEAFAEVDRKRKQ